MLLAVLAAYWRTYGPRAGPLRNSEIVGHCDRLVAFWDGKSRGTADSIRKAILAGKEIGVFDAAGELVATEAVAAALASAFHGARRPPDDR